MEKLIINNSPPRDHSVPLQYHESRMYVMSFPDSHSVYRSIHGSRETKPFQTLCSASVSHWSFVPGKLWSAARYLYPFIECNNQKSTSTLPPKNSFFRNDSQWSVVLFSDFFSNLHYIFCLFSTLFLKLFSCSQLSPKSKSTKWNGR